MDNQLAILHTSTNQLVPNGIQLQLDNLIEGLAHAVLQSHFICVQLLYRAHGREGGGKVEGKARKAGGGGGGGGGVKKMKGMEEEIR